MSQQLWDIAEVANYLQVTVATVYGWRTKKYGPKGRRVGKHIRWDPDEVRAWFQAQPAEVA
ncbi:helix-turn-helix domain-containing protein [Lentzea sp. BCCO 10_0856]|uniref:Helix-turn-helix domain-containing protein n=2 Tax=Lentzea TaxID=165301 RepID=A0ABU4T5Z2_9PSEU|nr:MULTISPECIES: helix-turn-helix domain-containing protein [unclassified Lentzea]MDX8033504.1 helix-turn-helix domain-containing protein [Lentzea sp. BCCO 10_0856]WVH79794.1 helix-turn-helix domain-containing protein [Lentzea sp. DG1S-22]